MSDGRVLDDPAKAQAIGFNWLEWTWEGFEAAAHDLSQTLGVPLCVEHCGLCCVSNTPTALKVEVLRAASHVAGLAAPERDRILDRIETWLVKPVLEVERPMDPRTTVRKPSVGPRSSPPPASETQAMFQGRCPLLDENLRCSVHAVRPMACRAYGVTRQPGPYCKRPRGLGETEDSVMVHSGSGLNRILALVAGLYESLRQYPEMLWWYVFPTILYASLRPARFAELLPFIPSAKLVGGRPGTNPGALFEGQEWVQARQDIREFIAREGLA